MVFGNRETDFLHQTIKLLVACFLFACSHSPPVTQPCCPVGLSEQQILRSISFSGEGRGLFYGGKERSSFAFEALLDMHNNKWQIAISKPLIGEKILNLALNTGNTSGDGASFLHNHLASSQWKRFKLWSRLFGQAVIMIEQKNNFTAWGSSRGWQIRRGCERVEITYGDLFVLSFSQWENGRFKRIDSRLAGIGEPFAFILKFN